MLLASLVLLGLFGLDGHVTQTEGVSLIIVYAIYLVFLVTDAMSMRQRSEDHAGVNLAVALKRRARMSVGNLIGSNIFDTLIPVGVAAVIVDLEFNADMSCRFFSLCISATL